MIHEIWLFLANTGLPLWFKQFGQRKHNLDPTLVSGLLTAIRGFSDQAIGSDLKDLVLENEKLHNFLVSNEIIFTIHIDNRVDPHKLDTILKSTSEKLMVCLQELNISNIESASLEQFQRVVKSFNPILNEMAFEIENIRAELIVKHDEKSFDSQQLKILRKVHELVPFLTNNQISFQIKDLKTNKIHFQQISSEKEAIENMNNVLLFLEKQDFFVNSLESTESIIFIGNWSTIVFKLPIDKNSVYILTKETQITEVLQYRKTFQEIKSKIQGFLTAK